MYSGKSPNCQQLESQTVFRKVPRRPRRPAHACVWLAFSFAILLALAAVDSAAETVPADTDDRTTVRLREIADGYLANRNAFRFLTCRFRVRDGIAHGIEDAVRRGPTSEVVTADGVWVVDGERERYERRVLSGVKPIGKGASGMGVAVPPVLYIKGGELAISLDGVLRGGGLYSSRYRGPGPSMTPWDMLGALDAEGKVNPGDVVDMYLGQTGAKLEFHGAVQVRDKAVEQFVVDFGGGTWIFLVDPAEGYLPTEIQALSTSGTVDRKCFTTDVRACTQGRWFPVRSVAVWVDGQPETGYLHVRELEVLELEVDRQPKEADFVASLASPMVVHDCVDPSSQITLPQGRSIGPADLAELLKACDLAALDRKSEPASQASGQFQLWLVAFNAALVVGLLCYFLFRSRRARAG